MEILVDHDCTKCKYYEPSSNILVRSYCKKCHEEITFGYCPCEEINKDEQNLRMKSSILDKIRAEIEEHVKINQNLNTDRARALCWCLEVIDKYEAESKDKDDDEE